MRPAFRSTVLALVVAAVASTTARAQTIPLRVRVTDTTGAPLPGATVSLSSGDQGLGSDRTDTNGVATLRVVLRADSAMQVIVQRLGFLETRRLVRPRASQQVIEVSLAPVAAALEAVHVETRAVRPAADAVIRGDEITATTRGVFDFFDVLEKLRPELLDHIQDDAKYRCLPSRFSGSVRIYVNERPIPSDMMSVLRQVKYDAIDEIRYIRCYDKSIAADDFPAVGHIYVTLRPTFAFDLKRGTFPKEVSARLAATKGDTTPLRPASARLMGVYDAAQGTPIEDAEVVNLLNGYSARTTRTGTVALGFVDPTGSLIRIQRTGYAPLVLTVTNHPGDVPLTVTLTPRGSAQPRLARLLDPADSVRKLLVSGFYERRDTLPVVPEAFLGGDKIGSLTRVSDATATMQRPLCVDNLLIDGVRVRAAAVDDLLAPAMVAAIETYIGGEIPSEFLPPGGAPRCATLIWTR